jgi:aryl-alcohol dehydrogenase-like predicted oxidoreductase
MKRQQSGLIMNKYAINSLNKVMSPIGLGCVTFGREIDQKTSFTLMDFAISHGVTLFDTASSYGNGASETIIGQWLTENPHAFDSVIISTKIRPPYTTSSIGQSVNQSLIQLGVPFIDILYLHSWDSSLASSSALKALQALVQEGKVHNLGVSNFNSEQLRHILQEQINMEIEPFAAIQNNHNVAIRNVDEEIRAVCRKYGVDIITYSPIGAGFLTGKYKEGVGVGTRFSLIPGHQDIYFNEKAFNRLSKLQAISRHTGYSSAYLALVWALHQPNIASVLVGGRDTTNLEQAFAALTFNNPEILLELEAIQ